MITLEFDTHGNNKQKETAIYWNDDVSKEIVYGGAKGGGKSYLGCSLIFHDALVYAGTHYFIARKHLNDLRKYTIPSIYEVFEHWGLDERYRKYNGQDNYFELYNGSRVYLLDAKYLPSDPDYMRFGSMQMTRGWIEEAGEFERDAKQNLLASIGRWKNQDYRLKPKLLMTCNPSKNFLYTDFYKPSKKDELDSEKQFVFADIDDNKMVSDDYKRNLKNSLTGNLYKRLVLGQWEFDDNPDALCDYGAIESIFSNNHVKKTGKKYLTCDVARFGSDKARILVWDGWVIIEKHSFDISATTEIQSCINTMRNKYSIPKNQCIADADGVGGGVVDNTGILAFYNNSKPTKLPKDDLFENYRNLQVQCIYELAEIINSFEIFFEVEVSENEKEEIIEELEYMVADNEDLKKLDIKSKEWVKKQIGRSPDWRDVLMMRTYFETHKKKSFSIRA